MSKNIQFIHKRFRNNRELVKPKKNNLTDTKKILKYENDKIRWELFTSVKTIAYVVIDFNKEKGSMKCLFASSTYNKTRPFNYFKHDMIKHNKEHYSKTELNRIIEKWWEDISDPEDKLYPLSRPYIIKHKDDRYCKSKLNKNAVCRLYTSGQICEVTGANRFEREDNIYKYSKMILTNEKTFLNNWKRKTVTNKIPIEIKNKQKIFLKNMSSKDISKFKPELSILNFSEDKQELIANLLENDTTDGSDPDELWKKENMNILTI
jgi:hypothetical protein